MSWTKWIADTVDRLVADFSYYVVPLAIVLLSILTLVVQDNLHTPEHQTALTFRVLEQHQDHMTTDQARQQLQTQPAVRSVATNRSEYPFWIDIPVHQAGLAPTDHIIEFPSRHTTELTCWNGKTLEPLGSADRRGHAGAVRPLKGGFILPMLNLPHVTDVLCRATHSGPATMSVVSWPQAELRQSVEVFQRSIGLLEGGLVTLALFTLMTAIINREIRYVVFAAWLIGNLRLGALSMGWDTEWLERAISPEWLPTVRKLSMASYYLLTYTLFSQFFRSELGRIGYGWLLRVVQYTGVLLLALALFLPYSTFLPLMWVLVGIGAGGVVFFLARLLIIARSRIALWYSAALALVLSATFGEVLAAAFHFKLFFGFLNSVTAALAASLMTAVAFAEQMRAERLQRRQAQAELHSTYQVTPVGLFTLEADGFFVRVNPALQSELEIDPAGLLKARWEDYFAPGSWQTLLQISAQPDGGEAEVLGRPTAGTEPRGYLLKAARAGTRIEGSLQDITERLKSTERLRFLANHDSLTNALNRRGIEQELAAAIAHLHNGQPLALAYLDLDRFKLINDLYGHHVGDEVLKQVYSRITNVLGAQYHMGRLGGDEFLVIMHNTSASAAAEAGRKIVEAISISPFRMNNRAFQVKVSVGVIEVTQGMTTSEAISTADRACRDAKKRLHQNIVVYEKHAPEFRQRAEELHLIEELGSTFSPTGLFLEMQPIMSLREPENALDFEVLLRMRDSNQNLIPAGKILAAAEASGHMAELDKWVLTTTLEWLAAHLHQLTKTRFVCVNLSGSSLNDEAFIEDLFSILARHEKTATYLCIEITESVALHDLENTRRVIDHLRSRNIKIALDDFGAGYTSFSYLKELTADALKIDGSFIRSMNQHPADIAIVEAIVELTHNLGMRSIAEWVEDTPTLQALAEMGVDYVQGYIVARPQLPEAILGAQSAASFITDESLAQFVRDIGSRQAALANEFDEPPLYYH